MRWAFLICCCCLIIVVSWLFCDPMDYGLPSSSVHGIFQARLLEWLAISFSRGSSWPRDRTWVSCTGRQIFLPLSYPGSPASMWIIRPSLMRCWRSWTVQWRPTRPARTNTEKRCPFHYRGLECKSRKLRNTWSNRQIWPWSIEWSRAKAKFCQENALVIANTLFQQHGRRLYTWTSPDGQHWNQIDYILCSQRWRSSIQSAKTRPGADCNSDNELLIAKFRLKLKKVGKTIRPFRYDLNQIPYDYTVEVRNRYKGLDLIDREPNELWTEVRDMVQETGSKTIPKKKKCKKAKWLSKKAIQIAVKEKRKGILIWMQSFKE